MNTINLVKGYPIAVRLGVTNAGTPVAINDGSWILSAELRYQTKHGTKPFELATPIPQGNSVIVELTSEQTSLLDHRGSGYVLLFKASKDDDTVFLVSETMVAVRNAL